MSKPIFTHRVAGRPIKDWGNDRSGIVFAKIETCEESVEETIASLARQFESLPEIGKKGMKKSEVDKFCFFGSHDYTPMTQAEHDYMILRVKSTADAVLAALGRSNETESTSSLPSTPKRGNSVTFFVMSPNNCTIDQ